MVFYQFPWLEVLDINQVDYDARSKSLFCAYTLKAICHANDGATVYYVHKLKKQAILLLFNSSITSASNKQLSACCDVSVFLYDVTVFKYDITVFCNDVIITLWPSDEILIISVIMESGDLDFINSKQTSPPSRIFNYNNKMMIITTLNIIRTVII